MADELRLPIDAHTTERLHRLGGELLRDKQRREAFIRNREEVLKEFDLQDVDLGKLDENVVEMLADPSFNDAVETKDIDRIRDFVQERVGGRMPAEAVAGTFDFDFDIEVEVEVVVVAVAVFDFAAVQTRIPDEVELVRRRELVRDSLLRVTAQAEGPG
jgi:hypothetical protein